MSAKAPSDEAWATLLTQIAELQRKIVALENRLDTFKPRITALEQEPSLTFADLSEIKEDIRNLISYIARRDDVPEMKVN